MVALFGSNTSGPAKGRGEMYRLVASVASEAMGIGKSSDVLTVLGGKASCRRKFVLNVHLVDESGSLVSKDLAIVASVAYAHDHSPVVRDEKPFLAEPPLFTTFNGVEFPAQDRPTRMVAGRASFKLAISLLSSKCDNRLFCICFKPQTAAGDAVPICAPCYSKPIRSISRKRTQSAHISPAPPLLLLAGLDTTGVSSPQAAMRYANGTGRGSFESDGLVAPKLTTSPSTSSENDGEGGASPAGRGYLQGSSRSSSVTSMHYLSPTSAGCPGGMLQEEAGTTRQNESDTLMLRESPASAHSIAGTVANSRIRPFERFNETDPSGSSAGGMASTSCSPVSSTPANNHIEKKDFSSCSLSLRLSPSDSDSPTSGALTSESSFDKQDPARAKWSPLTSGKSRPAFNAPNFPMPNAGNQRPFRPYATVGPCNLVGPMASDFQLGTGISLAIPQPQSLKRSSEEGPNSTSTLLERVHQLRTGSPIHATGKVESVLHNFSLGAEARSSDEHQNSDNLSQMSLEEEEKSLQYLELNLMEITRELQRRKDDLRCKRRRLLEDEARMHSIMFQSSSWIENMSGRFSL